MSSHLNGACQLRQRPDQLSELTDLLDGSRCREQNLLQYEFPCMGALLFFGFAAREQGERTHGVFQGVQLQVGVAVVDRLS